MTSFQEKFKSGGKSFKSETAFVYSKIDLGIELKAIKSPNGRFYEVPGGAIYPSVTTITGAGSKSGIIAWRKKVGEVEANRVSRVASNRGTKLHTMCENYLLNKTVVTPHKIAEQLFTQIKPILDDKIGQIYMIEQSVYSDNLTTAGRLDLFADYEGIPSIIDFKSSSKEKKLEWLQGYFSQGVAYSQCIEERLGTRPRQVVIVIGVEETNQPQIFKINSRDQASVEYFQKCKKLFIESVKWRMKNASASE